jgi:hypothetical protein
MSLHPDDQIQPLEALLDTVVLYGRFEVKVYVAGEVGKYRVAISDQDKKVRPFESSLKPDLDRALAVGLKWLGSANEGDTMTVPQYHDFRAQLRERGITDDRQLSSASETCDEWGTW